MHDSAKLIRTLYEISAEHHLGLKQQLFNMLTLGRHIFDMEIGIVAHIEDNQYTVLHLNRVDDIGLEVDDVFNLGDTYCVQTIETGNPVVIQHAQKSRLRTHPAHQAFKLESYSARLISPVVLQKKPRLPNNILTRFS